MCHTHLLHQLEKRVRPFQHHLQRQLRPELPLLQPGVNFINVLQAAVFADILLTKKYKAKL